MDQAHRVGHARPQSVSVMVGHELRLVRGDVHLDGAVVLAALAGDAQVQRLKNGVAAPQVGQRFALQHFPQQAGPAAS